MIRAAVLQSDDTERPSDSGFVTRRSDRPLLLLVDDEKHVVEGLALHLRRRFDVETTTNPREALTRAQTGHFDAIISDLRMPGLDGVDVLREVRHASPRTARLLLTGQADVDSAVKAVNDAGVHRFLTKPCLPEALARAVTDSMAAASVSGSGDASRLGDELLRVGLRATLGAMAGSIGSEMRELVERLDGSLSFVRNNVERGTLPALEDVVDLEMTRSRMKQHASQLVSLSRPRELRFEELSVSQLAFDVVSQLKRAGFLRRVPFDLVVPPVPIYVVGDRATLGAAITSLLVEVEETALVSRQANGDEARVSLELRATADLRARLSVAGTSTVRRAPHESAGVAYARAAAEQLGGRVHVRSIADGRVTVHMDLPLAAISYEAE